MQCTDTIDTIHQLLAHEVDNTTLAAVADRCARVSVLVFVNVYVYVCVRMRMCLPSLSYCLKKCPYSMGRFAIILFGVKT